MLLVEQQPKKKAPEHSDIDMSDKSEIFNKTGAKLQKSKLAGN